MSATASYARRLASAKRVAQRRHAEDAAAVGQHTVAVALRAGVEHLHVGQLARFRQP